MRNGHEFPTVDDQDEQHVKSHAQPATDEPFLNRVLQVRTLPGAPPPRRDLREQSRPGGLIFGLIRLRSSTFIGVQSNAAMQVTNVSVTRRTIIQTSENRKIGDSTTAR
jgi:hypothetical protein